MTGSLGELFETAAAGTPDAVAVEYGDERVTYRELSDRSGWLAIRLLELGVGAEDVVGVAVTHPVDRVAAVLAAVRAGAAWLSLDPDGPPERMRRTLADAGVLVVIDDGHADLGDAAVVRIAPGSSTAAVGTHVTRAPHAEQAAYVIYPTGSTGRPMGVTLTHGGLTNLIRTQAARVRIDHTTRMLQFAAPGTEASVFELATVLSVGGTLVIPPRSARPGGTELVDLVRATRISHALLPPAVLAALPPADLPDLRVVLVGGGGSAPRAVTRRRHRTVYAYGPAEVAVLATTGDVTGGGEVTGDSVPAIGAPLPGLRVVLLGPDQLPVPAGEPGEIAIGGVGVGRGYLGRPGPTARRFVPDPTGGVPGGRLFRTGDLGRWRPDGQLDYLGRADQVAVPDAGVFLMAFRENPLWTEVAG
jgi:amino acid adenylation domain-containing protein